MAGLDRPTGHPEGVGEQDRQQRDRKDRHQGGRHLEQGRQGAISPGLARLAQQQGGTWTHGHQGDGKAGGLGEGQGGGPEQQQQGRQRNQHAGAQKRAQQQGPMLLPAAEAIQGQPHPQGKHDHEQGGLDQQGRRRGHHNKVSKEKQGEQRLNEAV